MEIAGGKTTLSLSLNVVVISLVKIVNLFHFRLSYFLPFVLVYFVLIGLSNGRNQHHIVLESVFCEGQDKI
jgi:hypothetical protein